MVSRDNHGPVQRAIGAIGATVAGLGDWKFASHLFVDVDSQAGASAAVHIALADFGGSGQHLVDLGWEVILFLNAERSAGDVYMVCGELIHWVILAALLESGFDAEDLAEVGDFLGLRDPTDGRDARADEIDDMRGNQRVILRRIREDLAHRLGRGAGFAHLLIPVEMLWPEQVFDKIKVVRFHPLGKQNRVGAGQVRMHVVQQFGCESQLGPDILEHRRNGLDVQVLIERLTLVAPLGAVAFVGPYEAAAAIAAFAVLQTDVPVAVLHRLGDDFGGLLFGSSPDVIVTRHRIVGPPAEHLVHRHAGALALDVPQGFIHGSDHFLVDRSPPPVSAEVRALPQVLDSVGILADEPRFQVLFESSGDGESLVIVVRRSNSVESRFAGYDFQEDPAVIPSATGSDHFDILDGQRRQSSKAVLVIVGRRRRHHGSGQQSLEKVSALHFSSPIAYFLRHYRRASGKLRVRSSCRGAIHYYVQKCNRQTSVTQRYAASWATRVTVATLQIQLPGLFDVRVDLAARNHFDTVADFVLLGDSQHHLQCRQPVGERCSQHSPDVRRGIFAQQHFAGYLGGRHGLARHQENASRVGGVLQQVNPGKGNLLAGPDIQVGFEFRGLTLQRTAVEYDLGLARPRQLVKRKIRLGHREQSRPGVREGTDRKSVV